MSSRDMLGTKGKNKPGAQPLCDPNMMLEMQLKMAKRAETSPALFGKGGKGGGDGGSEDTERKSTAQQQRNLVRQSMLKKVDSKAGLRVKMANSAASGAVFAQKRAARARVKLQAGAMAGIKDPNQQKLAPPNMGALAE